MKKQLVLGMLVLLGLCWYTALSGYVGLGGKYQGAMDVASMLEKKEIYIKAIDSYKEALNFKANDFNAMYGIAKDYENLGEYDSYEKQMHAIVDALGPNEKAVDELYHYYVEKDNLTDAAKLVYSLKKQYADDALVNRLYEERKGDYTESFASYDRISSYNGRYAVCELEGKKGLIDDEGELVIAPRYDVISAPSGNEEEIAVAVDGKAYWIDKKGYKIAETDEHYEYLSSLASGLILAGKDGRYGYLNASHNPKSSFEWEDATMVYDQLGAVKKNGKWALINSKLELVTDYIYDNVIYNEWHIASVNGRIWAGNKEGYQLLDKEGKVLTKNTYDEAKVFASGQPCAVKKGEKWGFVDLDGNEVITPQYEDAQSFCKDFAPVRSRELWGLIDLNNKVTVDYQFDEMMPLNDIGATPVKRGDIWSVVRLKIYEE